MAVSTSLFSQLFSFVSYLFKRFWLFYFVLFLSFLVLLLEYMATSLMVPMAPAQAGGESKIVAVWNYVALVFNLQPGFRTWLWIFFLLMSCRLVLGYLLRILTTLLGKVIHRNLSETIFGHIVQYEPMSQVYVRSVGHYITLAGDDTFKSGTIVASLLQTLIGFSTTCVGLLVLYEFSPSIFFAIIAFLLVSVFIVGALMWMLMKLNFQATALARVASTTFVEVLNSLRSIRSLHGERFVMSTYAEQIHVYLRMLVQMDAIKTGVKVFPAIVLLLLAAVALRPGVNIGFSDATLFAGTIIVIRVFASLGQMVTAGSQLLTDLRAIKDIRALLGYVKETPQATDWSQSVAIHTLTLDQVCFGYGDRGRVLDQVSFRFDAGHTYAIVGPSGAGKSTLADILLGLSDPDSGQVLANGGALPLQQARPRFLLVEQQPKIFSSTIKENLLLGAQASDDVLYKALATVNLEDMVRALDQGLDTRLSYLGENFSGGQRQRLGIARALVRQPDVLILDEATSALDPANRVEVVAKLRERMKNGIIIFITHDPDIAALADEVLPIGAPLAGMAPPERTD